MINFWPGTNYAEADRGRFESSLLRYDYIPETDESDYFQIAYTDGDVVVVTSNCKESDREAVIDFAETYGFDIQW